MDRIRKNYKKKKLIKIALLVMGNYPCLLRILSQRFTWCYGIPACGSSRVHDHNGGMKNKGRKIQWKKDK